MKATFTRATPSALTDNAGVPEGWFVISHRWIPETADRRRAHGRWFRIRSAHCAVFRVLRFSPQPEGQPGTEQRGHGDRLERVARSPRPRRGRRPADRARDLPRPLVALAEARRVASRPVDAAGGIHRGGIAGTRPGLADRLVQVG